MKQLIHYLAISTLLSLIACGGGGSDPAPEPPANLSPNAVAPNDGNVIEGLQFELSGADSTDTDGTITSYQWTQTAGVPSVILNDANSVTASFMAPAVDAQTQLTFQLTVTDDDGATDTDSVVVTVLPDQPPQAVAPSDFPALQLSVISLDGSDSSDDVGIVSYSWQQTGGEPVTLSNANQATASFTAPAFDPVQEKILTFSLTVTDAAGETSVDSVSVTIVETSPIITLSGKVTFDLVPLGMSNNGLDHPNTIQANVRGATVELLNAAKSAILETATSDTNGDYSFEVSANTSYAIRVKAEYLKSGAAPSWNFTVVDNTSGDAIYAMDSSVIAIQSQSRVVNLHADSGWTGSGYTQPRVAAPFAILDSVYQAVQKVLGADSSAVFPALRMHWSILNINVSGGNTNECLNYDSGQIGTSFYTTGAGCPGIYILGDADSDTDEFDDHVVIHEWGHYFEDRFSRSESIGGSHSQNEKLDMRVAVGEGFGNAFSGIVTDNSFYRDSFGTNQSQSFGFDLEQNPATNRGWFSESSVQSLLYDLYDSVDDGGDVLSLGFTPIYNAMVNGEKNTDALTSIFSLGNQIKVESPANASAIDALFATQSIIAADDFGSTESNNGGDARNLPIYKSISIGGPAVRVCSFGTNGQYNKLGNRQFLVFDVVSTGNVSFTAAGQSVGDDPDIILYQRGEIIFLSEAGGNESITRMLSAGRYVLEVYEYTNIDSDELPKDTCIDITIS